MTSLARVMPAARALELLAEPWRRQQHLWNGDPAATWVWLETSLLQLHPRQPVLVLGKADRPSACLNLVGSRSRIAFPLARVRDRFAWAPGVEAPGRDRALAAAGPLATIYLPYVPLDAVPGRQVEHVMRPAGLCPIVVADSWAMYLESLSRKLRQNLRRAQSRLGRSGAGLEIAVLAPGETADRFQELARVEAEGHRRGGHHLSGQRGLFLQRVVRELDEAGHVRTYVYSGVRGIQAYLLGFVARRRYLLYSTSFDVRHERLSLGALLFREAVHDAIGRSEHVDLGNGDSEFKMRFATASIPLAHVLVVSRANTSLPAGGR
jgi:hypothetical protein